MHIPVTCNREERSQPQQLASFQREKERKRREEGGWMDEGQEGAPSGHRLPFCTRTLCTCTRWMHASPCFVPAALGKCNHIVHQRALRDSNQSVQLVRHPSRQIAHPGKIPGNSDAPDSLSESSSWTVPAFPALRLSSPPSTLLLTRTRHQRAPNACSTTIYYQTKPRFVRVLERDQY